jgi:flagellar biosynthesis protein FlhB
MDYPGEKTEQATPRKLEEAAKKGQFPRSAEVQTVFVLAAALAAMMFAGRESWQHLMVVMSGTLGHLHELPVGVDAMREYWIRNAMSLGKCIGPILVAAMIGGLLAGGLQSRFQTASEALAVNWERLNPAAGFKRVFSFRNAAPSGLALLKLAAIVGLTYSQVLEVLHDPIFFSAVSADRVGAFIAGTSYRILTRVIVVLVVIAAMDYTYQVWRTNQDMMMTKEEVKEESKNNEANPQVRSRLRRRRRKASQQRMLMDVAKADVVVTNPTHLAVALRYDRKHMRAPRIVAKGSRLNAAKIRETARKHQVPVVENKPLARMMFKYGRVGGEIPAQLFAAAAEIFAWVYRVNRYRYYTEQNHAVK